MKQTLSLATLSCLLVHIESFSNTRIAAPIPQAFFSRSKFLGNSCVRSTSSDNDESTVESGDEDSKALPEEVMSVTSEPTVFSSVTASSAREEADDEGVIPRDGSLLLLIPSLAIAIGGLVVAGNIALNSGDQFSQAVGEIEGSFADKFKPKPAIYEATGECRGLCSNQQQDIDSLRSFLEKVSGKGDRVEQTSSGINDESTPVQADSELDLSPETSPTVMSDT